MLLLDVWREVARHLDLPAFTEALRRQLARKMTVRSVVIRRWDPDRAELVGGGRTGVPTPHRGNLLEWAAGRTAHAWHGRGETGLARLVVPESIQGACAAGPVYDGERFVAVAVFVGPLHEHAEVLTAVLEPIGVAIANDARLHELARLREAADADRQVLLRRLGRQDVSEAIIGEDGGLREVMLRVAQVAPTDAPVLILGETGSGKEVVARALHDRSRRASGPFLRVNCGAIPPDLVDSELFGHERGAFTGAVATRRGWFERADGGTLFLDEVAELPAAAQVRLLRVLQDGLVQRVGAPDTVSVDVRIVAATHRDMAQLVRSGGFREDLWYRISVFPLRLPPVRERPEDIPLLAAHFAEKAGIRLHGRPLYPSPEDLARLVAYDWPGNVRELAAVIDRAAILGDGRRLDVPHALGVGAGPSPGPAPPADDREGIRAVVEACHGRIEGPFGAAARLGVNPATLRSRMRKLGIGWSGYRRRG